MVRFSVLNEKKQQVMFEFKDEKEFKFEYESKTNIFPTRDTKMIFTYIGEKELECETFGDLLKTIYNN